MTQINFFSALILFSWGISHFSLSKGNAQTGNSDFDTENSKQIVQTLSVPQNRNTFSVLENRHIALGKALADVDGDGVQDEVDIDNDNDGITDADEGRYLIVSDPVLDGFDSPLQTTINGNNIQNNTPVFNGWRTTPAGSSMFNVIRVNGAGYSSGADNAQSGNQYLDINGADAYIYKTFTLLIPTVVSASGWVSNRETALSSYPSGGWSAKIEILNEATNTVVTHGNTVNLTKAMGDETWYQTSLVNFALPAGTYRIRLFVHNYGHADSLSFIFSQDTDGDGIPDYLDNDSDNDGCPDAIEGDEFVLPSQLDANKRITGGVNPVGIPNAVNAGGSADLGNDQGQGVGDSADASINYQCIDSDNDGYPDNIDLDDDNDGILDINECSESVVSGDFFTSDGNPVTFTAPAADLGFVFDIYTLDNSFNITINGIQLSVNEIDFQANHTQTIGFIDGTRYGQGGIPEVYHMTGNAAHPLVRVVISPTGKVSILGSKATNSDLYELTPINGNSFNSIVWYSAGTNTVTVTQSIDGPTYITGYGVGYKKSFCDPDGDGISNELDLDSDGDGCPDALEGTGSVAYTQLNPDTSISGAVDSNGVPVLVGGNGQQIGNSQDASRNSCYCYKKPVTDTNIKVPAKQGITALSRASSDASGWPESRQSAWMVLEAKTKGFVINRVAFTDADSDPATPEVPVGIPAANFVEGMMVYDTTNNCLKIYNGTAWNCYSTPACP